MDQSQLEEEDSARPETPSVNDDDRTSRRKKLQAAAIAAAEEEKRKQHELHVRSATFEVFK